MEFKSKYLIILSAIIVSFLGISLFVYAKTIDLIKGPQIIIESPVNMSSMSKEIISIEGKVKNASSILLNGRKIYTREDFSFNEKLLLSEGYNIITVEASDRFGRIQREVLELFLNKNNYVSKKN